MTTLRPLFAAALLVGAALPLQPVLAADPAPPTPDAVVRAVTAPYLDLLQRHPIRGMRWVKIVGQTAQAGPADDTIEPHLRESLLPQVRRAFPAADPDRLEGRWAMSLMGFVYGISRADEWPGVLASTPALTAFYEDLVTFVVGGAVRLLNRW